MTMRLGFVWQTCFVGRFFPNLQVLRISSGLFIRGSPRFGFGETRISARFASTQVKGAPL